MPEKKNIITTPNSSKYAFKGPNWFKKALKTILNK